MKLENFNCGKIVSTPISVMIGTLKMLKFNKIFVQRVLPIVIVIVPICSITLNYCVAVYLRSQSITTPRLALLLLKTLAVAHYN